MACVVENRTALRRLIRHAEAYYSDEMASLLASDQRVDLRALFVA